LHDSGLICQQVHVADIVVGKLSAPFPQFS